MKFNHNGFIWIIESEVIKFINWKNTWVDYVKGKIDKFEFIWTESNHVNGLIKVF